jgi:hypothetical protein
MSQDVVERLINEDEITIRTDLIVYNIELI